MRGWIAGIVATVISGVLVVYLTQPSSFDVTGSVLDASTRTVVSDAQVRLTVRGRPESQATDSNGQYYFAIERGSGDDGATLLVEAKGYEPYTRNGSLQSLTDQSPNLTRSSPEKAGPGAVPGKHAPTFHRKDAVRIVLPK
jgi:hypothetical protein